MDRIGFWNTRGLNNLDKQKEMYMFMNNSQVGMFGPWKQRSRELKLKKLLLVCVVVGLTVLTCVNIKGGEYGCYGSQ